MAAHWYQCTKCGKSEEKNSMPGLSGCSKGGSHSWHNIGESGPNPFTCKHCGVRVSIKNSVPANNNCPDSGGHSWKKGQRATRAVYVLAQNLTCRKASSVILHQMTMYFNALPKEKNAFSSTVLYVLTYKWQILTGKKNILSLSLTKYIIVYYLYIYRTTFEKR